MSGNRHNGGIIGPINYTTLIRASGVWDITAARQAAFWPSTDLPNTGLLAAWDFANASSLFDAVTGGSNVAPDGEIARVEDGSGNGRHLTQANTSYRPLRKTNQINGLDVGLFDGIDDEISYLTSSFSNLYVLYVINPLSDAAYVPMGSNPEVDIFDIVGQDGSTAAALSPDLTSVKIDGSEFTGTRDDLHSALTGNHCVSITGNYSSWQRFGLASYGGVFRFNGYFGEVLIYDQTAGIGTRNAAESYLLSKWGIS